MMLNRKIACALALTLMVGSLSAVSAFATDAKGAGSDENSNNLAFTPSESTRTEAGYSTVKIGDEDVALVAVLGEADEAGSLTFTLSESDRTEAGSSTVKVGDEDVALVSIIGEADDAENISFTPSESDGTKEGSSTVRVGDEDVVISVVRE